MRITIESILVCCLVFVASQESKANNPEWVTAVPIDHVNWVDYSKDSNLVRVSANVWYLNGCYKGLQQSVEVTSGQRIVNLFHYAYVPPELCTQALVPNEVYYSFNKLDNETTIIKDGVTSEVLYVYKGGE